MMERRYEKALSDENKKAIGKSGRSDGRLETVERDGLQVVRYEITFTMVEWHGPQMQMCARARQLALRQDRCSIKISNMKIFWHISAR